jgi:excisionase family DNA binding protein
MPEESVQSDAYPIPIEESDQQEIKDIYEKIRSRRAKLVGPDGDATSLPASVYSFFLRLLADLEDGKSVSIIQVNAQLTTVQASNMLGVSRQFLIGLLNKDEIPHHMVGTHRRVYVKDLLAYKSKRDAKRKKALDELIRAEVADGTFDRMSADDQLS